MGIDESEVSRLLRGDVPKNDPVWGEVSGFLDDLGSVYPTVPTTALEDRHLAAIAHETRLVHSQPRRPRQGAVRRLFTGPHRVLAGSVGSLVIALTAGVGVSSALGMNPLGQLFAPQPIASSLAPQTTSPNIASSDGTNPTIGGESRTAFPRAVPTPTALPTPAPAATKTPGSVGDEHKNPRATEKANNAATPTPHNTKASKPRPTKTQVPPRATPTPPGKDKSHD